MWHLIEKFPDKGDVDDSIELVVENKTKHIREISVDHLMAHFQCDICHFSNIYVRDPMSHRLEDYRFLCAIHRATLHSLWIRRPGTV